MMQTSLSAWSEVRKDLNRRQLDVLHAIIQLGGRATMHRVALRLNVPLNTISGRFSELQRKGYLQPVEIDQTPGYRARTVYEART